MARTLSEAEWNEIDPWIFQGWNINAMKAVCEAFGVNLYEAINLVEQRRVYLSEHRPDEFIEVKRDIDEELRRLRRPVWDGRFTAMRKHEEFISNEDIERFRTVSFST